eukprot:2963499-Alexandrium_andersonii.AAC.1
MRPRLAHARAGPCPCVAPMREHRCRRGRSRCTCRDEISPRAPPPEAGGPHRDQPRIATSHNLANFLVASRAARDSRGQCLAALS